MPPTTPRVLLADDLPAGIQHILDEDLGGRVKLVETQPAWLEAVFHAGRVTVRRDVLGLPRVLRNFDHSRDALQATWRAKPGIGTVRDGAGAAACWVRADGAEMFSLVASGRSWELEYFVVRQDLEILFEDGVLPRFDEERFRDGLLGYVGHNPLRLWERTATNAVA